MNRQTSLKAFLFLVTTLPIFGGCYTQTATDGDYWGYTGRRAHRVVRSQPVASDTTVIIDPQPAPQAVAQPAPEVGHADTVVIDDTKAIANQPGTTTVINNYYVDPYDRWYDYYRPHVVVGFSFGSYWPYYGAWYGGYYPYEGWYHVRRRWAGVYAYDPYYPYPPAPFYGCYAPIYDPFYDPFIYHPYWGSYAYGYGYHHWDNDEYGYGGRYHDGRYLDPNPNHKIGRITSGEGRATVQGQPGLGNSTQPGGNGGRGIAQNADAPNVTVSRATMPSGNAGTMNQGAINNGAGGRPTDVAINRNAQTQPAQTTSGRVSSTNVSAAQAAQGAQVTSTNTGRRVVYLHRTASGSYVSNSATPSSSAARTSGQRNYSSSRSSAGNGGYSRSNSGTESSNGGYSRGDGSGGRANGGGGRSTDGGGRSGGDGGGRSSGDGGGRSYGGGGGGRSSRASGR